jgi:hypothetical protein
MNLFSRVLIVVLISMLFSSSAYSACRKSYVCDDYGNNCRYRDICDNSLDLPSTNLPPIPPLPTTELKPLPSLSLPPLGTSKCEYMQVNGHWQNVCH